MHMYAKDGQLHTSNTDLVSLEGRISVVVNSANAWYENNRIIANPSNQQGMLLGNTEYYFHSRRLSKDLGLGHLIRVCPHGFEFRMARPNFGCQILIGRD